MPSVIFFIIGTLDVGLWCITYHIEVRNLNALFCSSLFHHFLTVVKCGLHRFPKEDHINLKSVVSLEHTLQCRGEHASAVAGHRESIGPHQVIIGAIEFHCLILYLT